MLRSKLLVVSSVLACLCASTTWAAPVLINFDRDPDGGVIPNGLAVNTTYATLGVTFSREGGSTCGPDIYANNNQPAGFGSSPNVVSPCAPPTAADINDSSYGVIKVSLDRNATRVCIDVRPGAPGHAGAIRVFDASDTQINATVSAPGLTQQICAAGLGIRYARIAGSSSTSFAHFDNLVVHFGGGPATQSYYQGIAALAAPTCSSGSGGSISTGTRTWVWNTPSGGASITRVDARNGVAMGSPATYPANAGSGTQDYATFGAFGLGHYPFTYTIQEAMSVGGNVVSVSTVAIHCVADGPAGTSYWVGMAPPALENPQASSYQSGIGLISGWSCVGPHVGISFDGLPPIAAPYGSGRLDTASVCGAWNVYGGFGLLSNFNLLGTGSHTVQLYVNGQVFGPPRSFQVTVPAGEFLSGVSASSTVNNFPSAGRSTTLIWQQSQQNFGIQAVSP
ncbi:hypothetical protein BURK2_01580 [Burkholderiales bacterium]|nr:MAG: hypothetical protein F9K47_05325 [Burkholderiales bacterium]CAG0976104.1 hypothetical protein BURK2_01580 [Burkholderiales bacterium]